MNIPGRIEDNNDAGNDACFKKDSELKEQDLKSENGSADIMSTCPDGVDPNKLSVVAEHERKVLSKSEKEDMTQGMKKCSKKLSQKGKRVPQKLRGRRYSLRSSQDGVRVLRSMSNVKSKSPAEAMKPAVQAVQPMTKRKKKRRKAQRTSNDEFLASRNRVRYLLTRMSYEQNLIDAYSGEGWKGQNLEKIRPEKELERAKTQILKYKLRLRDAFQRIDSLLSQGKLEESLFDAEGEICSEDISCANCGSKDVTSNNDIILCDGICDRGFHQKCLNPPLLTEDIPPGDQGWLCPACDCKVDCIDLLNEFQGSDLSIEDSWEKVFPEAAAISNGAKQYDESNFPSDDSEDDNYDPNILESHIEDQEEGSSSEESDFTASSKDSEHSKQKKQYDNLGFPSDDSEDDDYDPEGPDPDKDSQKKLSSSDESDFTSDSDDFCAELVINSGLGEVSTSSLSFLKPVDHGDAVKSVMDSKGNSVGQELCSLEADLRQEQVSPVQGKRQRCRLDYKKLYEETYGKESSESSDDEDWSERSAMKKGKKDEHWTTCEELHSTESRKSSRRTGVMHKDDAARKLDLGQIQMSQAVHESSPGVAHQKLHSAGIHDSVTRQYADAREPDSSGANSSTVQKKHFGPLISEKLREYFNVNRYPSRETKESMAQELGLTFRQISKWFESMRHSMKVSYKEAYNPAASTTDKISRTCDPAASTTEEISRTCYPVASTSENSSRLARTRKKIFKSDKVVENLPSKQEGAKDSKGALKTNIGSANDISGAERLKEIADSSRKKAISRELRRRKSR
ncbi:homeobox protein HOX1A isoform X2 [Typha latifolia]|uniref:homeobox protein HOX1A isoform X2 n=1 Tax=Typha latifolia TaxID=4733 RepID=UPI003C2F8B17